MAVIWHNVTINTPYSGGRKIVLQKDVMMNNLGLRDINPLLCGTEDCAPGHCYGPIAREYYLLHYVYSGKGRFETERGKYELHKGQIFVIRPFETTLYTADRSEPWTYGWVGFSCGFPIDGTLPGDVIDAPECEYLFRAFGEAGRMEAGREWHICGKIYEMLALLNSFAAPKQDTASRYVRMAQNYIESRYAEPLKITRIAESLNLNRSYFSKIFRAYTEKSPQRYLVDFRLQKAAELLASGGLPPGEVARRVGYTDVFNFSRMFRRRYGVSPSYYAENRQSGHYRDPKKTPE